MQPRVALAPAIHRRQGVGLLIMHIGRTDGRILQENRFP